MNTRLPEWIKAGSVLVLDFGFEPYPFRCYRVLKAGEKYIYTSQKDRHPVAEYLEHGTIMGAPVVDPASPEGKLAVLTYEVGAVARLFVDKAAPIRKFLYDYGDVWPEAARLDEVIDAASYVSMQAQSIVGAARKLQAQLAVAGRVSGDHQSAHQRNTRRGGDPREA